MERLLRLLETYTITASANGCTSAASASVTINAQPETPAVPVVLGNVTQPTCAVATGSFTISNFNAANSYNVSPSNGVTISVNGTVTAPAGTYTLTASANGCISAASASVTINVQPETPAVPVVLGNVTQPTCAVATGSFTISNFDLNNTYDIVPSAGVTISSTGLVTAPAGTYTLTASANGCISAASASVTINAQPQTPAVPVVLGNVTQPTCAVATGSFTISNFDLNNTYDIVPSAGVTISSTGLVTAPAGTYTLTASANGCISAASASVTINAQPETPAVPVVLGNVTQPTCAVATGSFTISNFDLNNTYDIVPSAGVTISSTGLVTAPAGTYTLTASANGCISAASASVTINAQPETPAVPVVLGNVTQPTCAVATGSFTISNFDLNNTYDIVPSAGVTISSTGLVTAPAGTYTLTASANGCISAASASVTINVQPETPAVPVVLGNVTQPTCAVATGSFTISNFDLNNTYDIVPSAGVTISSTGLVTAPAGTYTLTASANGCISAASASVTINAQPETPAVPVVLGNVTQPTCAVATGSFTISNFDLNNTYDIVPSAGVTISSTGLVTAPAGTYTLTASANGCISAASASVTINAQPETPAVPVVLGNVTQPTCAVATGSFTISNFDLNNTYDIVPSAGVTISSTGLVTAPAGTYTLTASANGCISAASASVTINAQPETPAVPVVLGNVTQPTCAVATGSFVISNFDLNNTYDIVPSAGVTISATGLVTAPAGTYTLTASANGCISAASASVTINAQPETPAVPVVLGNVTQPTCAVATGSFTISNFDLNNTYDIVPSAGVTISSTGLVTAPAGTYTLTASANGCISAASASVTINAQPETPAVPVVLGNVTQPTCAVATGSFTISNFDLNNTYDIVPSASVTISSTGLVTAPAGTYTLTASANGCISAASASVTINAQPETPAVPVVLGNVTQPTCAVATGSFTISNFDLNNTYDIVPSAGVTISATGLVTAPAGTYTLTASANGCISAASASVTINAQPETPAVPVVLGNVTQPTCAVATGSFVISNFDLNNTYDIVPSAGVTISATGLVTAPAGTYTLTASANGCISAASASVTINAQPETPAVPVVLGNVTQPTCAVATGSFTISNFDAANLYTITPSTGVIISATGEVTAPEGTYTLTASANGCISAASASVIINAQPETPAVPVVLGNVTQPTCAVATGSFTISNFDLNNTYDIVPSAGVTISATGLVTAPAGTYTLTASANGCISAASASVTINAQPETPAVPVVLGNVTQPTCAVATGSFTISNFDLNNTYDIVPSAGVTISATGLVTAPAGTYTLTASANGCISAASASVTINAQPETPAVPVVLGNVTQPTCAVATGSFTISNFRFEQYL